MMFRVGCVAAMCVMVTGHGSLVIPPARNNYGQKSPANTTGDPHFNQGPCVGGACLWFSEGCFLGCSTCSATMPPTGNQHNVPNCSGFVSNTPTLPEEYRTYNIHNLSSEGDWTRYHPWRSPGRAPVSDSCGVAGAYLTPTGGGGETPEGAHQGDRGSNLPPTGIDTNWVAGKTAQVGWMIAANHGGGYSYSLCPKSEPITEECLNKLPLTFADLNHTIQYLDGRPSVQIPAIDVSVGTFPAGSTWRLNPIPACSCDWGRGCSINPKSSSLQKAYTTCADCDLQECGKEVGTEFPVPFPNGYGQQIWNRKRPSDTADDWVIVDRINVPTDAGEYVLRWRWDTEQNPQVWTHCSDVTIVSA
eukprot:m.74039 g.74039  ORF g.74039 m.74039 type:complete len:360 (+) comp18853_c0_seq1:71-1150(+)